MSRLARITEKKIKKSLEDQLKAQGKTADFYMDMINDYMYYWNLKKELTDDIKERGLRYTTTNGNGVITEKANESIVNLQKTTAVMLKILADMKLKEPVPEQEDPTAGYC